LAAQSFAQILMQSEKHLRFKELMSAEIYNTICQSVLNTIALYGQKIDSSYQALQVTSLNLLAKQQAKIAEFLRLVILLAQNSVKQISVELSALMQAILMQDPKNVLKQGYVLVTANQKLVTSKAQAVQHTRLVLAFKDGELEVEIK
jgi:exonuclease VII large subunit